MCIRDRAKRKPAAAAVWATEWYPRATRDQHTARAAAPAHSHHGECVTERSATTADATAESTEIFQRALTARSTVVITHSEIVAIRMPGGAPPRTMISAPVPSEPRITRKIGARWVLSTTCRSPQVPRPRSHSM